MEKDSVMEQYTLQCCYSDYVTTNHRIQLINQPLSSIKDLSKRFICHWIVLALFKVCLFKI